MGPSSAASCSAAGAPPEGCLASVVDERRGKRGLSACRCIPRDLLTGIIMPVRKYLRGVSAVIG